MHFSRNYCCSPRDGRRYDQTSVLFENSQTWQWPNSSFARRGREWANPPFYLYSAKVAFKIFLDDDSSSLRRVFQRLFPGLPLLSTFLPQISRLSGRGSSPYLLSPFKVVGLRAAPRLVGLTSPINCYWLLWARTRCQNERPYSGSACGRIYTQGHKSQILRLHRGNKGLRSDPEVYAGR